MTNDSSPIVLSDAQIDAAAQEAANEFFEWLWECWPKTAATLAEPVKPRLVHSIASALRSPSRPAEGEVEPVAWIEKSDIGGGHWTERVVTSKQYVEANGQGNFTPLYTHPTKPDAPLPAGDWVLVPREPTEAMHVAGVLDMAEDLPDTPQVKSIYRAMLAAAPTRPISPAHGVKELEWRGIATAPKDGEVVLALTTEAQSPATRISWWDGDGWVCVWKPEKFVMPGPHRWWPTHWQPMPTPPALKNGRS